MACLYPEILHSRFIEPSPFLHESLAVFENLRPRDGFFYRPLISQKVTFEFRDAG
jgi:hypothetical protein